MEAHGKPVTLVQINISFGRQLDIMDAQGNMSFLLFKDSKYRNIMGRWVNDRTIVYSHHLPMLRGSDKSQWIIDCLHPSWCSPHKDPVMQKKFTFHDMLINFKCQPPLLTHWCEMIENENVFHVTHRNWAQEELNNWEMLHAYHFNLATSLTNRTLTKCFVKARNISML